MSKTVCIVTGAGGLVGSEAVRFFSDKFDTIIGIDNNQRSKLFGESASIAPQLDRNSKIENYIHLYLDIVNPHSLNIVLSLVDVSQIKLIIHAAAQPSHDWATNNIMADFNINTVGTLNMLEFTRLNCPETVFIHCSTNKVYGDYPNQLLGYYRSGKRFNRYSTSFGEDTPVDRVLHSFFGCSKLAADTYVQEYGKHLGMKTVVFRCGCITGAAHAGAELHGFLSYLFKCAKEKIPYTIYGYDGCQVRDNIHAYDLASAFYEVYKQPLCGSVFNIGGGNECNCSVLEAIEVIEQITGSKINYTLSEKARTGDHIFWITDNSKFQSHFPNWRITYDLISIIKEMNEKYEAKNINSTSIV